MEKKRTQITVTGVVQGVWFRKSTKDKADELGVSGWVKNLDNGSVFIEAQGPNPSLETFITWCYQGPDQAIVTGVETQSCSVVPEESEFVILR